MAEASISDFYAPEGFNIIGNAVKATHETRGLQTP